MITAVVNAQVTGTPPDQACLRWLKDVGEPLRSRLLKAGLLRNAATDELAAFIVRYINQRNDVKETTRSTYRQALRMLVDYFGERCQVNAIGAAQVDAWVAEIRTRYAPATVSRNVKRARQFFSVAVRWNYIDRNPFDGVKVHGQSNAARAFFVTRESTDKLLAAAPDHLWRLIIALGRYGGLRIPSELAGLTWADVDWERRRLWVKSPKTERIPGREGRWVPIFPELMPHLEACFDVAPEGETDVLPGQAKSRAVFAKLKTIVLRAGLTPWPRLFHNLRASRQTELAADYPLHVACAWLGNSPTTAAKHYLTVTDGDFERASALPAADVPRPAAV